MAKIPIGPNVNPGAVQGDRLSMNAPDVSAPARALQGLGRAISGLAAEYQANQQKMNTYNANLALEKWNTDQTIGYQADLDGSAPDGSDFLPTRSKNLQDSFLKVRQSIKDPELQAKADLVFERLRGDQVVRGTQDVKRKQYSHVIATTTDSVKTSVETGAIQTEAEFNDYFTNVIQPRVNSVISDPLERQKAYEVFGKQLRDEFLRANPQIAMPKKVEGGRVPIVVANQFGRVSKGSIEGVSPVLIERFRQVQDSFGQSLPIVSGYRNKDLNAKAGGANKSQHLHGNAIDIDVSNLTQEQRVALIETASNAGITGIGVYKNSLHFDIGPKRAWGPNTRSNSIPPWAAGAIQRHLAGKARSMTEGAGGIWNRVVMAESGGKQSAVSPKGAIGRAQVMPGTGPEAAKLAGLPWDEERFRTDGEYNEALGKAYLNEQYRAFGGDMRKALAAYNAGPGMLREAIKKGGDNWLNYMPDETQAYVAKVMGGPSQQKAAQYVMPERPRGGMWDGMDDQEWNRYASSGQKAFRDSLDLGIEMGEVIRSDIEFAPIDDGDKAVLLRRWDERNKDEIAFGDFVGRVQAGGYFDTSGDSQDRKQAAKLLDAEAISQGDPDAVAAMFDVYRKTTMVPKNAKAAINSMLRSKDASKITTALSYMDAFERENPRAFQQEFTEADQVLLTDYRNKIDYSTPQQIAEDMTTSLDPATEGTRKERGKEAEKTADKIDLGDVMNYFDPSVLPLDQPELTPQKNAESELMADYRRLYVEAYKLTGDDDKAKEAAAKNLTRVWSSSVANGGRVMKWPPEIMYGPQAMINGSYDWMREQVEAGMLVRGMTRTVDKVVSGSKGGAQLEKATEVLPYYLVADSQTTAEAAAGKPPSYMLWYMTEDGEYDIAPTRFWFDVKVAMENARIANEAQRSMDMEQRFQEEFAPDPTYEGVP